MEVTFLNGGKRNKDRAVHILIFKNQRLAFPTLLLGWLQVSAGSISPLSRSLPVGRGWSWAGQSDGSSKG